MAKPQVAGIRQQSRAVELGGGSCGVVLPKSSQLGDDIEIDTVAEDRYRLRESAGPRAEPVKGHPHGARDGRRCHIGHAAVSYTHLRAHETDSYLVCRL